MFLVFKPIDACACPTNTTQTGFEICQACEGSRHQPPLPAPQPRGPSASRYQPQSNHYDRLSRSTLYSPTFIRPRNEYNFTCTAVRQSSHQHARNSPTITLESVTLSAHNDISHTPLAAQEPQWARDCCRRSWRNISRRTIHC
jgi:hypothetical protein